MEDGLCSVFWVHVEHDRRDRYRQDEKTRSIFSSDYGPRTLDISPDGKTLAVICDTVGSINRSVNFIDIASSRVTEKRVIRERFQFEGCWVLYALMVSM